MSESRREFFRGVFQRKTLASLAQILNPIAKIPALSDLGLAPEATAEEAGLDLGRENENRNALARLNNADAPSHRATGGAAPADIHDAGHPKEDHGEPRLSAP